MQQTGLQMPKIIYNVGLITVIISVFFFMYGLLGLGNFGFPAPLEQRLFGGCLIALSLAGLVSSLVLISVRSRKHLWHALMSYWMLLLILFAVWDLSNIGNILRAISEGRFSSSLFITLGPIIYSLYCMACFLTKDAKKYFI
jgi:hypothetical protein